MKKILATLILLPTLASATCLNEFAENKKFLKSITGVAAASAGVSAGFGAFGGPVFAAAFAAYGFAFTFFPMYSEHGKPLHPMLKILFQEAYAVKAGGMSFGNSTKLKNSYEQVLRKIQKKNPEAQLSQEQYVDFIIEQNESGSCDRTIEKVKKEQVEDVLTIELE